MGNKISHVSFLFLVCCIGVSFGLHGYAKEEPPPNMAIQTTIDDLKRQIETLQAKIIDLQSQLKAANEKVEALTFKETLALGSKGDDVKKFQQFLIQAGYDIPAGSTGYYGTQTKTATVKFQKDHGIDPIGIGGPKTIAELNKTISAVVVASPVPITPAVPATPATPETAPAIPAVPAIPSEKTATVPVAPVVAPQATPSTSAPPAITPSETIPAISAIPAAPATPATSAPSTGEAAAPATPETPVIAPVTTTPAAATTTQTPLILNYTKAGSGEGDVSMTDGGPCSVNCTVTLPVGSSPTLTLTAKAASGSVFSGWSGACTGNNLTCVVTLPASVTATFDLAAIGLLPPPARTEWNWIRSTVTVPPQIELFLNLWHSDDSAKTFNMYVKDPGSSGFTKTTFTDKAPDQKSGPSEWWWILPFRTVTPSSSQATGQYEAYATTVDSNGVESGPSPTATRTLYPGPIIVSPVNDSTITQPFNITLQNTTSASNPTYTLMEGSWYGWAKPSDFVYDGPTLASSPGNRHHLYAWIDNGYDAYTQFSETFFSVAPSAAISQSKLEWLASILSSLSSIIESIETLLR